MYGATTSKFQNVYYLNKKIFIFTKFVYVETRETFVRLMIFLN